MTTRTDLIALIEKNRGEACILWPGRVNRCGSPRCGGLVAARFGYEHFVGPIPERHYLRRSCDLARCINPDHHNPVLTEPVRPVQFKRADRRLDRKPRIVGDIAYVPLTRGYEAIIDAQDAEAVGQYIWHIHTKENGNTYARRTRLAGERQSGDSRNQMLHQFLLKVPDDYETDHANRNSLDNRRDNLRPATHSQNMSNRMLKDGKFKGVRPYGKSKYLAQITAERIVLPLGVFRTAEEAARRYDIAARLLHGEFASLNFPD